MRALKMLHVKAIGTHQIPGSIHGEFKRTGCQQLRRDQIIEEWQGETRFRAVEKEDLTAPFLDWETRLARKGGDVRRSRYSRAKSVRSILPAVQRADDGFTDDTPLGKVRAHVGTLARDHRQFPRLRPKSHVSLLAGEGESQRTLLQVLGASQIIPGCRCRGEGAAVEMLDTLGIGFHPCRRASLSWRGKPPILRCRRRYKTGFLACSKPDSLLETETTQ